jgi:serine/threonine-protein kinase
MTEAGGLSIMADRSGDVARCPNRDELAAFERGQLPLERLESIAEHLSHCAACETTLQQLQAENQIVRYLRLPPSESLCLDESVYARLEDRARDVLRQQAEPPTVPEAGASGRDTLPLPVAFGAHLLLEQLPATGMGVVFKARQESLKRVVALKVIKAAILASAEARNRFRLEAETLARMRHANVVQIHEFGEYQGEPFFTMEWLDGGTLANKLGGRPQDEREAAELMRTLARAVQALHGEGIVHRDLKPGNILFDADGTPKIADFGLVKLIGESGDNTQPGAVMGTPPYMAPEQARSSRDIGNTADVYALGAILYEMLTGRPPLKGATPLETMELVRTQEPEWPSKHRRKLDRHLEAICMKCLEKKPADRYPSAAALADQLDRWLKNEPTFPPPPSRSARMWKAVRRHPRAVAAVCMCVLLGALASAAWYFLDPDRPVKNIERRLRRGETVTLIGETGGPRWSHWGLRQGVTNPVHLKDGAFSMTGLNYTVLTLLPDPQGSYRLSVEVRHENTTPGAVGLAFLHSRHDIPQGKEHCLCTLTFNDWEANSRDPVSGKMFSRIDFMVLCVQESGSEGSLEFGLDKAATVFYKHFVPAGVEPGEPLWRPLAVEVRPEGVDLYWKEDHLAHISRKKILENFQNAKKELVGGRMIDPLPDLHPAFSPRDALGLFVARTQASFRRVEVKPLPEP